MLGVIAASVAVILLVIPAGALMRGHDFQQEAWPPYQLLYGGHLEAFVKSSPAYVGSLILRAPLALLAMGLGGGWRVTYIASALPCIASAPLLGAWLTSLRPPEARSSFWTMCDPFGLLLVLNPIFIYSILCGHPEDILSASLAIAGVVQASRGKPLWAMALVLFAAFNESWALVALPVTFVVLPDRHLRALAAVMLTAFVVATPLLILHGGISGAVTALGSASGTFFYPGQLWWWFGPNTWVALHAHELIIVVGFTCATLWWAVRGRQLMSETDRLTEGLILLAFVLLLRCAMDPWNNIYYELPFVMAVFAIEHGRFPKISILVTLVMFVVTVPLGQNDLNWNMRALAYQLAAVPMITALMVWLYGPTRLRERLAAGLKTDWQPDSRSATPSAHIGA